MSQYPECKHGHGDQNSECQQCNADDRISELSTMCWELKEAIISANRCNPDNFSSQWHYFDKLAARAERVLFR